jgi:hypothetical protein
MKILILVTAMLSTFGAYAQQGAGAGYSQNAVMCPSGTYAKDGSTRAKDVKDCSAANKPYAERFQKSTKQKR